MKLGDGLMTSKSERQRTSGPQKRTKSDFMYCSQCYRPRSRKLDLPLSVGTFQSRKWQNLQTMREK